MKLKVPNSIRISRFSVKMFLLVFFCVVVPLVGVCVYIKDYMEKLMQDQLSQRVIQNISRNERNICDSLQKMAFLSNAFVYDEELRERMQSLEYTAYSNVNYFDDIIRKMSINGAYDESQEAKIIIFDKFDRVYSNWGLNYQNYEFLLEQDWVKESEKQKGHAVWAMFSPSYIIEERANNGTYISLAKSISEEGTTGERIGTIIISIEQRKFSELLMEYAYEDDMAYVCIEDGTVLLTNDDEDRIGLNNMNDIYNKTRNKKTGSLQENVGGTEYLISYYMIPRPWVFDDQQMKVYHFTNYEEVSNELEQKMKQINMITVLSIGVVVFIAFIATKCLVRPIVVLSKQMEEYTLDATVTNINVDRNDEIGRLNKAFCKMSDNIKALFLKLSEENEIKEKYRFESLRAQLNPHFLFNTLTSIRWMAIIRGANNIVESIDALAYMLKYSMSRDNSLVTLREEIENIRNYVYIQNCRYGEHCKLNILIDDELYELKTMKFILQPIVENAIIHGYDKSEAEIIIHIMAEIKENTLYIIVEDNGIGMSRDLITQFEHAKSTRMKESKLTGIGLTNVDECIRITYGEMYGIQIDHKVLQGTKIIFILPVIKGKDEINDKSNDC